jgi:ribosome biogenesis SPOUT family RNA methylase Rps3
MSKPIKSTLELAMEKAAKLPKLTKEEIRERYEREYGPLGRAIAKRFLMDDLAETRLRVELFKHEGERGEIVRKAFVERMCQSIDLEDEETTIKVLEASKVLVDSGYLEEAASRLGGILGDYERKKQRELAATEEAEDARVRDLGISGSAIRINPQENEGWRQRLSDLQREFRPEVDEIRRELTDHLMLSCAERKGAG